MRAFLLLTCVGISLVPLPHATALQSQQTFGTCGWWHDISKNQETYKIGFAQGVVIGALSDLMGSASTPDEKALSPFWDEGQVALLRKPAMMAEVFDKKCADYRNSRLLLHHLAFLGTLEIGGLPEARIETALDLFRAPTAVSYGTVFAALAKK